MLNIRRNTVGNQVVYQMSEFGKVVIFSDCNVRRDKELTFFGFDGGPALKLGKVVKFGKMSWKINSMSETKMGYHSGKLNAIELEVTPVY